MPTRLSFSTDDAGRFKKNAKACDQAEEADGVVLDINSTTDRVPSAIPVV